MVYTSSREILGQGCFNLRKFVTNATSLQALVDSQEAARVGPPDPKSEANVVEADETYVEATLPASMLKHSAEYKVLGVRWNTALDHLVFCTWMPCWKKLR